MTTDRPDGIVRCSWEGCGRTTTKPTADGWAYCAWPPPVLPGFYCRRHADWIEAGRRPATSLPKARRPGEGRAVRLPRARRQREKGGR